MVKGLDVLRDLCHYITKKWILFEIIWYNFIDQGNLHQNLYFICNLEYIYFVLTYMEESVVKKHSFKLGKY